MVVVGGRNGMRGGGSEKRRDMEGREREGKDMDVKGRERKEGKRQKQGREKDVTL